MSGDKLASRLFQLLGTSSAPALPPASWCSRSGLLMLSWPAWGAGWGAVGGQGVGGGGLSQDSAGCEPPASLPPPPALDTP